MNSQLGEDTQQWIDKEWATFTYIEPKVSEKQIALFRTFDISLQHQYLKYYDLSNIEQMSKNTFSMLLKRTYRSNTLARKTVYQEMSTRFADPLKTVRNCFPDHPHIHACSTLQEAFSHLTDMEIHKLMNKLPELYVPNVNKPLTLYPRDTVITYTPHYEIGIQTKDAYKMTYLKLYDWCTFDYDISCSSYVIIEFLEGIVKKVPECCFLLYQTNRGYHVHIMNELIDYKDPRYLHLSHLMHSDPWYTRFSHRNGYKLRISLKPGDTFVAHPLQLISGTKSSIHPQCNVYRRLYEAKIQTVNSEVP